MRIVWALFILAFAPLGLHSQSIKNTGYIITNDGDTVRGLVKLKLNENDFRRMSFTENGQSKSYLPTEILGYGIEEYKHFQSFDSIFIERIIEGEISINYDHKSVVVFYGKDTVRIEESTRSSRNLDYRSQVWKGNLKVLTKDCPSLHEKIDAISYRQDRVLKVLKNFINCQSIPSSPVIQNERKPKLSFGVEAGLSFNRIRLPIDQFDNSETFSQLSPEIGIVASLAFPIGIRVSQRLTVQRLNSEESRTFPLESSAFDGDNIISKNLDIWFISLPLNFEWAHQTPKGDFMIFGGIVYDIAPSKEVNTSTRIERFLNLRPIDPPNVTVSENPNLFDLPSSYFGLMGGIGYSKDLGKIRGEVRLSYANMTGAVTNGANLELNRFKLAIQLLK